MLVYNLKHSERLHVLKLKKKIYITYSIKSDEDYIFYLSSYLSGNL